MTLPSSYRKANNHEDGPFRLVDRVEWQRCGINRSINRDRWPDSQIWAAFEILTCGHRGARLGDQWTGLDEDFDENFRLRLRPAKKRRCYSCRETS